MDFKQLQLKKSSNLKQHIKYILLGLILCLCHFALFPQISKKDSIISLIKTANHDTTRINILNELIDNENDDKISMQYNEQMKALSEKLSQSNENDIKIKGKKGLAFFLNNIGYISKKKGNNLKALEYYHKSLKILEEIGDKTNIGISLSNIGVIYENQGDLASALEYYFKSLKIQEGIKDKAGIARALNNIGVIYSKQNNLILSLEYYHKSLKIQEEINDNSGIANSLYNIGVNYAYLKQYEKAINYIQRSLVLEKKMGNKYGISFSFNNLGSIYFSLNKYKLSLAYSDSSLSLAEELGFPENIRNVEEIISKTYEELGQHQKALLHYKKYIVMRDSISNDETRKASFKKQVQFEFEKKEDAIKAEQEKKDLQTQLQIQKKNYWIYALAGASVILILSFFIAFLYFKQNKLRTQQSNLQLEQKLLRSQMNPHFIFNALGAIQSFIQKNKSDEATNYLSKFARLVRLILENSRMDYVSLEKEVKTLENYLQLQQLLFENGFDYTISVDEKIDQENICIPPMLAQPFIENALKHGIAPNQAKGNIHISFKSANNLILFEVTDNGIGITKAMELKGITGNEHKSLATEITNERLLNFNKNNKRKIEITIDELKNKMNDVIGTKVTFEIPFKYSA